MNNYGFEYRFKDRWFSFCVVSDSPIEARQMVAAMAAGELVGELKPTDDVLLHSRDRRSRIYGTAMLEDGTIVQGAGATHGEFMTVLEARAKLGCRA